MATKRIQSTPDSIPVYNKVNAIRIIISIRDCIPGHDIGETIEILSQLVTIFRNKSLAQTLIYLVNHGAATSWTLQVQLGLTEPTVYRSIRTLRAHGYIQPQARVQSQQKRSGPRPKIWGIVDCTQDQVAEAYQLHYRCLSPKYRVAEEIAQTLLTDYKEKGRTESTFREILEGVREKHVQFNAPDVADLVARYLGERGIKVWR